jgi:hypothetical protein
LDRKERTKKAGRIRLGSVKESKKSPTKGNRQEVRCERALCYLGGCNNFSKWEVGNTNCQPLFKPF